MTGKDKDKEFDRKAFKEAIAQVESSGGKYLDNPNSSAAGRYHFLYRYIQNIPLLKGVTKREFMSKPELQEEVMDMAIDGNLPGYPSYKNYAKELKNKYQTEMGLHQIAALTHFLGKTGVARYFNDPKSFNVPGKNASVNQYVEKFNKHFGPSKSTAHEEKDIVGAPAEAQDNVKVNDATLVKTKELPKQKAPSQAPSQADENNYMGLLQQLAYGGHLNTGEKQITEINAGGTHEQNPYGGVPMGIGANGKMNTVEEGEVKFGDYVFSNRLSLGGPLNQLKANKNTFAEGGDLTDPPKKNEIPDLTESNKDNRKQWNERYGSDTQYFNNYLDKTDPVSNRPLKEIITETATKQNLDPNFLFSTLMTEGLDTYRFKEEIDESYQNYKNDPNEKDNFDRERYGNEFFTGKGHVVGVNYLGLDTIGNVKNELFKKGYLDKNEYQKSVEESSFLNEKDERVLSADFNDIGSGINAAAAFIRNSNDKLDEWTSKNKINLTPRQRMFFQNVAYNAGSGNAQKMIESYNKKGYLKDESFISKRPDENWKGIHKNVSRRIGSMIGLDEQNILKFNSDMSRQKIKGVTPIESKPISLDDYKIE